MSLSTKRIRRPGFTLTEVMISLALSLVLILAVSVIFTSAAKTVGSGFALGDAVRAQRSIGQQLRLDVEGTPAVVPSGIMPDDELPSIIIYSERTAAFRNEAEERSDRDYVATGTAAARDTATRTFDLNGDGDESDAGETVPTYRYGFRNWRTDTFSFFSNGQFTRQTNVTVNPGSFVANFRSPEAWVWYGHLRLYDGQGAVNVAGSYPNLSDPNLPADPNPNNRFAGQWGLGRGAILLSDYTDIDSTTAGNQFGILDFDNNPQVFLKPAWVYTGVQEDELFFTDASTSLTPLTFGTSNYVYDAYAPASVRVAANNLKIEDYRCDLAGVSAASFRERLIDVVNPNRTNPSPDWWQNMFASAGFRFYGNSYPASLDDKGIAETAQYMTGGCLQFIVEFAGDFVQQNPNGSLSLAQPDRLPAGTGEIIDYVFDGAGVRSIRWYGLPRDSNGDGTIPAPGNPNFLTSTDVVPVRDLAGVQQPFEKRLPDAATGAPADYMNTTASSGNRRYAVAFSPLDLQQNPSLRAAGNSFGGYSPTDDRSRKPSLIRVTVQLADENGRLADGFSQEYVFRVP